MSDRTQDRTSDIEIGADGPAPLTAIEAASLLGVHERTVRRAIASGTLNAVKRHGVYRIAPEELDGMRRASIGISPRGGGKSSRSTLATPSFPVHRSPPIGREDEIATLRDLLTGDAPGLVTLTGPGGVGKTRLALAVGDSLRHAFRDGTWFVPLATIRDGFLLIPTIGTVLGLRVPHGPDAFRSLAEALRDRSLMLVLDNMEQLVASGPLLIDILTSCPTVRILTTSRVPLHVSGEQRYPVAPLSVPPMSSMSPAEALAYPAVQLFVERARQAVADFTLDPRSATAVSRLCSHLDGLPLAIELAAARVDVLSPQTLLDRLTRSLDLLSDGPLDQPERLRTMRNAISWSYELLPPESQLLFRRLSVFVGGFTLDSAESLGNALSPSNDDGAPADHTLRDLTRLVDGNLVRRAVGGEGADRYGMLQTLREFGAELLEQLDEVAGTRQAHAELWAEFARANHPHHREPTVPIDEVLDRLEGEMPNFRAALSWAREREDGRLALRLSSWLAVFWFLRDHMSEGASWLEWSLAHTPDAPDADRARALHGLGNLMWPLSRFDEADRLGVSALAMASTLAHAELVAESTHLLGIVATHSGRWQEARTLMERVRGLWDALGVQPNVGMAWLVLAGTSEGLADLPRARAEVEQALTIFRVHGPAEGLSASLRYHGQLCQSLGDEGAAVAAYRESVARWRAEAGPKDRPVRATLDELGPPPRSRWLRADDPRSLVRPLAGLARMMAAHGQEEDAALLLGALDGLTGTDDVSVGDFDRSNADAAALAARLALGSEGFARKRADGRAMTRDAALAVASRLEPLDRQAADPIDAAFGLTRREREVLHLLAEGLSDRDIAARLVVSRYTASNHVSNILGKLDAPSRTAAVGIAIRHRLA